MWASAPKRLIRRLKVIVNSFGHADKIHTTLGKLVADGHGAVAANHNDTRKSERLVRFHGLVQHSRVEGEAKVPAIRGAYGCTSASADGRSRRTEDRPAKADNVARGCVGEHLVAPSVEAYTWVKGGARQRWGCAGERVHE